MVTGIVFGSTTYNSYNSNNRFVLTAVTGDRVNKSIRISGGPQVVQVLHPGNTSNELIIESDSEKMHPAVPSHDPLCHNCHPVFPFIMSRR